MNPESHTTAKIYRYPFNRIKKEVSIFRLTDFFRKNPENEKRHSDLGLKVKFEDHAWQSVDAPVEATGKKVALITGATSGIGKAFACEFARQNYNLILCGRRKEILDQVAGELKRTYSISVEVVIAELAEETSVQRLIRVIEMQPNLQVLVNNAGYGIGKMFQDDSIIHQLEMIKVHIVAPLMFIHKVLPMMIGRKNGTIINVSSLAAFMPARTNIMYSSTKAFMLNFSESLYLEAKRQGIRMQCLCPGYTHSDFHARIGPSAFPKFKNLIPWMEPEQVVRYSMHCLNQGRMRCIPGRVNRVMVMLIPFIPRRFYYFLANRLQQELGPADTVANPERNPQKTLVI